MNPRSQTRLLCALLFLVSAATCAASPERDLEVKPVQISRPEQKASDQAADDRKLFPWMMPWGFGGLGLAGASGQAQANPQANSAAAQPNLNSMMAGNMMVGNAMLHPMVNPLSPANPFSPMSPGNPFNPLNPINQHRLSNRFMTIEDDDVVSGDSLASPVDLANDVFDDAQGLRVVNRCSSVKSQAIEIANRLMKKQNNKIFKELVSYLVKAKFLIGMTEIKLTRALRKRMFGLMTAFSSLDHEHFNFVDPELAPDDSFETPDELRSQYPSIDDEDKADVQEEKAQYGEDDKKTRV